MTFSQPFIERPIGTTLLAIGLFLAGVVAYFNLPVASLPALEIPTIRVMATLPGADAETMAARVAAPLERRLGEIPGVDELTSVNSIGSSRITVRFSPSRSIVGAAQDVQAAINAAMAELPADMPSPPTFRKTNPAASPIIILALTSKTLPPDKLYDVADTVIVQRLSQVEGVAEVTAAGAEQPAVRVRVNPMLLSSMGLSIDAVRKAVVEANTLAPLGFIEGAKQAIAIETNAQLGMRIEDYKRIAIKTAKGNVVRLGDVAEVVQGTRNARAAASFNKQPAILLTVTKSDDANVIETVDRIHALLPALQRVIPEGIDISVLSDRTVTLRASVHDMQITLGLSVALVMLVVYLFLRRPAPTIAAGVTVPLSLAGTCALMWAAGFSVNNLTLMALAVSVGFVVDDAIVMIENMFRNLERGMPPLRAALEGARQIGFTVIAIGVSLIAAFIPLLFNTSANGRLLREFSVTLAFAVAVSTVVSLTVTPMICAYFIRHAPDHRPAGRLAPHRGTGDGCCHARVRRVARRRAAPPLPDHAGHAGHRRRHGEPLQQDAEGQLPAGRHRPRHRLHPGRRRYLLRGHGQAAAGGAGDGARRPGGGQRRLLGGRLGLERLGQPGAHVHLAQVAQGARRPLHAARDRPPAPGARRHARPVGVLLAPPAISAAAPARAGRSTSSPSGAPTSRTSTPGCPRWSTG